MDMLPDMHAVLPRTFFACAIFHTLKVINNLAGRNVRKLFQAAVVFSFCVDKRRDTHIYEGEHDLFQRIPVSFSYCLGLMNPPCLCGAGRKTRFYRERSSFKIPVGGYLYVCQHICIPAHILRNCIKTSSLM